MKTMRTTIARGLVLLIATMALVACSSSNPDSESPTGPGETFAEVALGSVTATSTVTLSVVYTRTEVNHPENKGADVYFFVSAFDGGGSASSTQLKELTKVGPRKYELRSTITLTVSSKGTKFYVGVSDLARQEDGSVASEIRIEGVLVTDIRDFSGSKEGIVTIYADGRVEP